MRVEEGVHRRTTSQPEGVISPEVAGDNVRMQHHMVICRFTMDIKRRKQVEAETRTKLWKLKKI